MEVSEKRTKLDCFPVMKNENSRSMNNAAGKNWQNQDESFSSGSIYNPRKSMAWDSAFFTSPGVLDPEELFATLNFMEKKSLPHDSSEIENLSTISGSNARTSLAWDSAFFTSAGVLDPEELLATLNFMEKKSLPHDSSEIENSSTIGESNARRSLAWDSAFFTSAGVLDQEELSLVNRGFRKCECHHLPGIKKVWRSADSNSTIDSDGCSLSSLEIDLFGDSKASMHQASKVSENSILSLKLGRTAPKLSPRTSSQARVKPMQPSRRPGIKTRGSEISKEAPLPPRGQTKLGIHTGESNIMTSLRTPKAVGCTTSPLTASSSWPWPYLSANRLKMETKSKKDSAGVCMSVPKKPCLEDSPVFTSPSPNSNDKAQSNSMRRKVNSRLAVSSSNSRTPSSSARNRSGLLGSSLPNHVLSTPTSCSSISPATSRDRWSSESSSSTSAKRKSVDYSPRLDTIPCGLLPLDNDSSPLLEGLPNARPSCLRKPSPKIGFFDEEHPKFHPSIRSSRTENLTGNVNGVSSSTRSGKHQLSGSSVRNMKPGSCQSGVSCPSVIRPAHGLGATCEIERKGNLGSRKKKKIARASEGQVCFSSSKQSSKESEEAHDSDKENIAPLENQVEDLSRHILSIDLSKDLRKELKGKSSSASSKKCLAPVSSSLSDSLLPR